MKVMYNSITIFVLQDYEAISRKAANMVAGQINLKGDSVLGLATGSTPEGMYRCLVEMYRNDSIDFSDITTFNLDEYYDLAPDNPQSYAYYMHHHLFSRVNMKREHIHIPSGTASDVAASCLDYDRLIESKGNIDLQILGIGNNGHIGFNEPDVKFEAGTHLVQLDQATIEANGRFFEDVHQVPKEAVSMGIRNIMHGKKVVLLANGKNKAQALYDMIFGPVTPNLPASVLQLHNDVTVILDREAAIQVVKGLEERGIISEKQIYDEAGIA